MTKTVALIPLRGGSKSIPSKNIRYMAGKPLCAWVLQAACNSAIFSEIVVSTDSTQISQVIESMKLPVRMLSRPPEYASDEASTEEVMLHAAQNISFDVIVTIQATSPMLTSEDLQKALHMFKNKRFDSMLSVVRLKRFLWRQDGVPINYDPEKRPRRQEFGGTLMENGAFYFTKRKILESTHSRLGGRIGLFEMNTNTAIEVDEPEDWEIVERCLVQRRRQMLRDILSKIQLLVIDADENIIGSGLDCSSGRDKCKDIDADDAKRIELLRLAGVQVALISAESEPGILAKAIRFGIKHCYSNVKDKEACLKKLVRALGWNVMEVAYYGDHNEDWRCLRSVRVSAHSSCLVDKAKLNVLFVSTVSGGKRAVRELCDIIYADKASTIA